MILRRSKLPNLSHSLMSESMKIDSHTTEILRYPAGRIEAFLSWQRKPLRLEPYQVNFLQARHKLRILLKSRQIGMSFISAAEALYAAGFLYQPSAFISVNEREA